MLCVFPYSRLVKLKTENRLDCTTQVARSTKTHQASPFPDNPHGMDGKKSVYPPTGSKG